MEEILSGTVAGLAFLALMAVVLALQAYVVEPLLKRFPRLRKVRKSRPSTAIGRYLHNWWKEHGEVAGQFIFAAAIALMLDEVHGWLPRTILIGFALLVSYIFGKVKGQQDRQNP